MTEPYVYENQHIHSYMVPSHFLSLEIVALNLPVASRLPIDLGLSELPETETVSVYLHRLAFSITCGAPTEGRFPVKQA